MSCHSSPQSRLVTFVNRITRFLRSARITRASSLLRATPPLVPASVLFLMVAAICHFPSNPSSVQQHQLSLAFVTHVRQAARKQWPEATPYPYVLPTTSRNPNSDPVIGRTRGAILPPIAYVSYRNKDHPRECGAACRRADCRCDRPANRSVGRRKYCCAWSSRTTPAGIWPPRRDWWSA